MKPISKELAKLTGPRIDRAKIMEESRRSGVPDDELERAYYDDLYEQQEWERKEQALWDCIDREVAANAQHFSGNVEALRKALLKYFLGSGEVRFSSKAREEKFNEIVSKIDKEVR